MVATPGTIPSLPQYQPGALPLTGTEIFYLVSTANATSAASFYITLTDAVGKAPSVMTGGTPLSSDIFAFFRPSSGLYFSSQVGSLGVPFGNVAAGGTQGQIYAKNSGTSYDAGWYNANTFVSVGASLSTSGSATSIIINLAGPYAGSTYTTDGVLYGNGTSGLGVTAAGAANTLLVSQGTAPFFSAAATVASLVVQTTATIAALSVTTATVSSLIATSLLATAATFSNLSVTTGTVANLSVTTATVSNLALGNALSVPFGGIGTTTLTSFGVVYGRGTSIVGITSAPATGALLRSTGTAPFFSTTPMYLGNGVAIGTTTDPGSNNLVVLGTAIIGTSLAVGTTTLPAVGGLNVLSYINSFGGFNRVTSNFGVVSTTTLANITGLSASLAATSSYYFESRLYVTAGSTGGAQVAIGGTAGISNIVYEAQSFAAGALVAEGRATALLAALATSTAAVAPTFKIVGTVTTNATAGTLTVQIAQVAATTTTTVVLQGSTLQVFQLN